MPRMMQQIMVSSMAINLEPPERATTAPMIWEARPLMAMQPAIMPAIAQAAATEMQLLAPFARASKSTAGVMRQSLLKRLTTIAARMEIAAAKAMVLLPLETRPTSRTRGRSR